MPKSPPKTFQRAVSKDRSPAPVNCIIEFTASPTEVLVGRPPLEGLPLSVVVTAGFSPPEGLPLSDIVIAGFPPFIPPTVDVVVGIVKVVLVKGCEIVMLIETVGVGMVGGVVVEFVSGESKSSGAMYSPSVQIGSMASTPAPRLI